MLFPLSRRGKYQILTKQLVSLFCVTLRVCRVGYLGGPTEALWLCYQSLLPLQPLLQLAFGDQDTCTHSAAPLTHLSFDLWLHIGRSVGVAVTYRQSCGSFDFSVLFAYSDHERGLDSAFQSVSHNDSTAVCSHTCYCTCDCTFGLSPIQGVGFFPPWKPEWLRAYGLMKL